MSKMRPDGSSNSMDLYNSVSNASAYDVGYFVGYNGAQIATTTVLTEGGGALLNGVKGIGARGGIGLSSELKYSPRVRMRGLEDPKSHNFPYSFDNNILSTTPIPKKNGYNIFQLEGSMNGKTGVYEIGKTKNGVIDHRFFRPYK